VNRESTALVLGAGASCTFGFPTGDGLRKKIFNITEHDAQQWGFMPKARKDFLEAFERSQHDSIDSFLSSRDEFSGIGKAAIAYTIVQAEKASNLLADNDDHWYRYLLNKVLAPPSAKWDDFDPSWLSVVTFNYDRSLEVYLTDALVHRYNRSQHEVRERLREMTVTHVYGSLGSPWKGEKDYIPYGLRDDDGYAEAGWVRQAAQRIRVIPEGRDEDDSLKEAKSALSRARRICVLGFGFDETNLKRIGAPESFRVPGGPKPCAATAYQLSEAEIYEAASLMIGDVSKAFRSRFQNENCKTLLRNTHVLQGANF
jgi:hypothetical protein